MGGHDAERSAGEAWREKEGFQDGFSDTGQPFVYPP